MTTLIILLLIGGGAFAGYKAYVSSQAESAEARTIASLPPSIQHVVAQMDGGSQAAFFNEYERKKKKKAVGYLLWFFFGWHYLYTRKVGLQFAYWFTLGGFFIWTFADLFRMPSIIRSANEQIAREALQTLHIGVAFASMPAAHHLMTSNPISQPIPVQASAPVPALAAQGPGHPAPPAPSAPVGQWAADPTGRYGRRFHDGQRWTEHVETNGMAAVDYI